MNKDNQSELQLALRAGAHVLCLPEHKNTFYSAFPEWGLPDIISYEEASRILNELSGKCDFQQIIRCKDCCHSHFVITCKAAKQNPDLRRYVCERYGNVPKDHFCGFGERRKPNEPENI